jgi:neutral ceramidase
MMLYAGIARVCITPFWGVELTGWGYYIERRWQHIHDDLHATALVVDDGHRQVVLITLDLMVIDATFTRITRERIWLETGLPPDAILLTCSHTHNAPSAGGLLGVGECDPVYEDWASRQAATAAILAWRRREPVHLRTARGDLAGHTFNRTRPHGDVDPTVTTLKVETLDGSPLAFVVNFAAHPTVTTDWRPFAVSRDLPGEVCDLIEQSLPGVTAMYVQGACGDVNFLREYIDPHRHHEPAHLLASVALESQIEADAMHSEQVGFATEIARIPTRRWTQDEIQRDRDEAQRRLTNEDTANWRETIGKSMTNRPDDMIHRHGGDEVKAVMAMARFHVEWTTKMLEDLDSRPEYLDTEVQAIRLGDLCIAANPSEFFSPFAMAIRRQTTTRELMVACYANGRIGYLPDAHDIQVRSYAGYQSPKYCNQFPFTEQSGAAMCDAMLRTLDRCRDC